MYVVVQFFSWLVVVVASSLSSKSSRSTAINSPSSSKFMEDIRESVLASSPSSTSPSVLAFSLLVDSDCRITIVSRLLLELSLIQHDDPILRFNEKPIEFVLEEEYEAVDSSRLSSHKEEDENEDLVLDDNRLFWSNMVAVVVAAEVVVLNIVSRFLFGVVLYNAVYVIIIPYRTWIGTETWGCRVAHTKK